MICGFVDKDFKFVTKEITIEDAVATAEQDKYFSISVNGEYYIYFIKETYTEENLDKAMRVVAELNKELMVANSKNK